jgi:hypothetical protein
MLNSDFLSRANSAQTLEDLRTDLQDALKEYGELDLVVEILQNAIDAVENVRFANIVSAAGLDPALPETVEKWNAAVREVVSNDCDEFQKLGSNVELASYYKKAIESSSRRKAWWAILAKHLACDPSALDLASRAHSPEIHIAFNVVDGVSWITIEDNGPGMLDLPGCFRHTTSSKRSRKSTPRRLGVRGNHGWGLSAVLGLSNEIEVISRSKGSDCQGYQFSGYASFVQEQTDQPTNQLVDISSASHLSHRLRTDSSSSGTQLRIQLAHCSQDNVLGHALTGASIEKLSNLLRLYTPVGQLNDFVAHPAFHNYRKDELKVTLTLDRAGAKQTKNVSFDVFRVSECQIPSKTLIDYVDSGMPPDHSVHVLHRCRKGGVPFVSAAEIQPAATLLQQAEDQLRAKDELPQFIDENDRPSGGIPRGFYLGLSGGMRAELHVRPPRGITHAYYAFVLSEDIRPTLGRKHVLDQRTAPPKAAIELENRFEEFRKKTLPKSVPPMSSPKSHKWRREFFDQVIQDIRSDPPLTLDLNVRAAASSMEARVMLAFGELVGKENFGDMSILRAHLQDKYDFAFLYVTTLGLPGGVSISMGAQLDQGGYAERYGVNLLRRYGLGEFKAYGESVLDDFDENDPRKSADAIDLLVCWEFDKERLKSEGGQVDEVDNGTREFEGQTHIWRLGSTKCKRQRALAVIELKTTITEQVSMGKLQVSSDTNWVPTNYF